MFNIMVVEDDRDVRTLMDIVLRKAGYSPILAFDGIDALEKWSITTLT